nr:MAG TPA: hypothetical protein [Inoviridae sp.]
MSSLFEPCNKRASWAIKAPFRLSVFWRSQKANHLCGRSPPNGGSCQINKKLLVLRKRLCEQGIYTVFHPLM